MTTDRKPNPAEFPTTNPEHTDEDRKIAARRRFLRISTQGSAALVVTVAHRRTFAGIKKNVVASACASLQGTPDLKGANQKKALEASAMGTPKGLICRPRPPAPDPNKVGSCTPTKTSEFFKLDGNNYTKVPIVDGKQLENGCGSILIDSVPPNNTIAASYNYRLYEKGYCPIVFDSSGGLEYKLDAQYYTRTGDGTVNKPYVFASNICKGP